MHLPAAERAAVRHQLPAASRDSGHGLFLMVVEVSDGDGSDALLEVVVVAFEPYHRIASVLRGGAEFAGEDQVADDPHVTRRTYRGTDLEVSFDSDLCIHATECVRRLPAVFDRDRRPWILADNAPADEVSRVVEHCPTGALQYRRLDGQLGEQPAAATMVTPVEDGPLAIRGDLVVRHEDGTLVRLPRGALCRCGQSKNKPFCDNSHVQAGFRAPGASPAEAFFNPADRTTEAGTV
jgi:uncharacterized Fe-S cluster protein YjdI/CDGSH-type Zn-finger protein